MAKCEGNAPHITPPDIPWPQRVIVVPLDATTNGTYEPEDGYAYGPVNVNVSGGGVSVDPLNVTENGTYNAPDGHAYNPVVVDVDTVNAQEKTATPYTTAQVIEPDTGYNALSKVTVSAISYIETPNEYGTTVTIGAVAPA